MMRLRMTLAALLFAASASAENVLLKNNGLGAAVLGEIGVTAGALALAKPPPWQGYPKGGDELGFSNDATSGAAFGDCAVSEGSSIAKALMAQRDSAKPPPPDGVLSLSGADRQAAANAFDGKAMYQPPQPSTCPQN